MKKAKILSAVALAAVLGTTAVPVLAAPMTSDGTTEVTYTANSASPDGADWLISYPKKVVLSDYNKDKDSRVSLDFKVSNKLAQTEAYTGSKTVTVSVGGYTNSGYQMTGGTGTATMYLTDSTGALLDTVAGKVVQLSSAKTDGAGGAYLKASPNADGTFTKNVTFTFTDNTQ